MSKNTAPSPSLLPFVSQHSFRFKNQRFRVKTDLSDLSNPVFLQRKVIGKKSVAEAFWPWSSRAETGSLTLRQLPYVAGSLFFSSKPSAFAVPTGGSLHTPY